MVVKTRSAGNAAVDPARLDLGHVSLFFGMRINELVAARLAAKGFEDVRQSHGYVIQHLIERERSITELAGRMEVTQQAASKVVAELLRLGVVEAASAGDRRAKSIRLSSRGWRCVRLARKARTQIERRLVSVVGAGKYDEAKRILLLCFDELGGMERIRSRRIHPLNGLMSARVARSMLDWKARSLRTFSYTSGSRISAPLGSNTHEVLKLELKA